jgi:hypothetical protein
VVDRGAAAVAEAEDSMVDTLAVVIEVGTLVDTEVGIMVGIVEDTMAVIEVDTMEVIEVDTMEVIEVDTMEGSMVEVFTHIGDFGDGLFWDGPMQVGPTCPMGDIRI